VAAIRSNRHRTDEIQRWSSVSHSKALHLANVGAQCAQLAEQAVTGRRTHLSFLEALLQAELEQNIINDLNTEFFKSLNRSFPSN
jgi:hypothetical protein